MLKGTHQKNRDRIWHKRHMTRLKKRKSVRLLHIEQNKLVKSFTNKTVKDYTDKAKGTRSFFSKLFNKKQLA